MKDIENQIRHLVLATWVQNIILFIGIVILSRIGQAITQVNPFK